VLKVKPRFEPCAGKNRSCGCKALKASTIVDLLPDSKDLRQAENGNNCCDFTYQGIGGAVRVKLDIEHGCAPA